MGMLEDLMAGAMSGRGGGLQRPWTSKGISSGALAALLPVVIAMLASRRRSAGGMGSGGLGGGSAGGGLGDLLGQALGQGRGGSGGLGDLLGQVLGGGAGGMGGGGGLGGLLEKLGQGGLTQQAQSWVGSGQNASISAGQIRDVFGANGLAAIAQQTGISESEASEGLAQLLPEVVNHVTPQGRMPQDDELESTLEGLLRQFVR